MKSDWIKKSAKGKLAGLTALLMLLYAFLIFVIFGFDGGSSFWISFVFALFSIALACSVSCFGIKANTRLTDWIFSLPVIRWCVMYVIAEIAISTVFMIVSASWKIVFIPQFLLAIFFLILVFPCFAQKSHVAEVTRETVVKVSYVRQLNAKLVALIPRAEDSALKKDLEQAADLLRHSDPMSADCLEDIEQKMVATVDQLDTLIRNGNFAAAASPAKEICYLIEERNQLVIASKLTQY